MQSLRKIVTVFILIALLPAIFLVYELAELNKNENIVRETYQNQLDAILYSVNQYSDDIISSWANRIRQERRERSDADFESRLPEIIYSLLASDRDRKMRDASHEPSPLRLVGNV